MNIDPYVRFAMHHVWIEGYYLNRDIWDHEIIFIEQGSLKFTIEGKTYIAKQNDCVMLRPGINHVIEWNKENCIQPHVHFDFYNHEDKEVVKVSRIRKSQMNEEELTWFRDDYYKANNIDMPYIIHLKNPIEVKNILYKIIEEFTHKNKYSDILLSGLIRELIGTIFREFEMFNTKNTVSNQLNELISYMNGNVDNNLTLSDFSEKTHISQWKLIQLFNEFYHTTPIKYYNQLKYLRAKDLLENSVIPINEIAKRMNYVEPQTFSRWFKKIDGNYPSYYRKR